MTSLILSGAVTLALAAGLALPGFAWARTCATRAVETGFLNRTLDLEGRTCRYQVYVPPGTAEIHAYSDAARGAAETSRGPRLPVILFLHGSGERGTDGLLPTEVGLGSALRRYSARYPAIVVFPQAPPDSSWAGVSARIALRALEQSEREFGTDPERVYLAGMSMGGNGAWYLAYRHPERFAAMLVACGRVVPGFASPVPIVPEEEGEPFEALASRIRRIPVWVFHGDEDTVVPVEDSRRLVAALRSFGAAVRYTEIAGGNHNAWDAAFGSEESAEWLFAQRRRAGD